MSVSLDVNCNFSSARIAQNGNFSLSGLRFYSNIEKLTNLNFKKPNFTFFTDIIFDCGSFALSFKFWKDTYFFLETWKNLRWKISHDAGKIHEVKNACVRQKKRWGTNTTCLQRKKLQTHWKDGEMRGSIVLDRPLDKAKALWWKTRNLRITAILESKQAHPCLTKW